MHSECALHPAQVEQGNGPFEQWPAEGSVLPGRASPASVGLNRSPWSLKNAWVRAEAVKSFTADHSEHMPVFL